MIWAVVLAAGESGRMGRPKLLLPYRGKTIIETVLRNVVSSRIDRVVVVLGGNRREIKERIRSFAVKRVINRNYKEGMFSSVRRGLSALPASARAAVFVLADQPDVPSSVIDSLIEAYDRGEKGIVLPVYRNKKGHPLLIDLKYRREVEALSPDIGLRGLLRKHGDDIQEVRVSSRGVLKDIDDSGDYAQALGRIRSQERPKRIRVGSSSFRVTDNLGMEERPRRFSLPEALFKGSRTGGREDCAEHAEFKLKRRDGQRTRTQRDKSNVRSSAAPRKAFRERR